MRHPRRALPATSGRASPLEASLPSKDELGDVEWVAPRRLLDVWVVAATLDHELGLLDSLLSEVQKQEPFGLSVVIGKPQAAGDAGYRVVGEVIHDRTHAAHLRTWLVSSRMFTSPVRAMR